MATILNPTRYITVTVKELRVTNVKMLLLLDTLSIMKLEILRMPLNVQLLAHVKIIALH